MRENKNKKTTKSGLIVQVFFSPSHKLSIYEKAPIFKYTEMLTTTQLQVPLKKM